MADRKRQELLNERLVLQARIHQIDEELDNLPDEPRPDIQPSIRPTLINTDSNSLRDLVIAIVSEVGYMVTNTSIRYIHEARFNRVLAATRLNKLSRLEKQPAATLYSLTHPLQLNDQGLTHILNIWVRADWPIYQRIYLPVTMRLINLHFLDWYITNQGSRHHHYLSHSAISAHIGELIGNLGLDPKINHVHDSVRLKKAVIREIEKARREEATTHSSLAFRIITEHRQAEKSGNDSTEAATLLK